MERGDGLVDPAQELLPGPRAQVLLGQGRDSTLEIREAGIRRPRPGAMAPNPADVPQQRSRGAERRPWLGWHEALDDPVDVRKGLGEVDPDPHHLAEHPLDHPSEPGWPANAPPARSSVVELDRTATGPDPSAAYAALMAWSTAGGTGAVESSSRSRSGDGSASGRSSWERSGSRASS